MSDSPSIIAGKREGRDVANSLRRILDCIFLNIGAQGAEMSQILNSTDDSDCGDAAKKFAIDKLTRTIEINSAIVTSVCAIVVADTGKIIGATAPADAIFGYAVGELAGRSVEVIELIPLRLRDEYSGYWRKFWSDPRHVGVSAVQGAAATPIDSVRIQAQHLNGAELTVKVGWGHPIYVLGQRAVVAQIMHTPTWQDALASIPKLGS